MGIYTNFDWHPARIKLFGELIFAIIQAKTVRLKELALYISSKGEMKARVTKIERLLLGQEIDYVLIGKLIIRLLGEFCKLVIVIDRTNWQFGKSELNFFVAAVILGNISIPIAWMLLDKKGNSNTEERKALIEEILKIISLDKIEVILADREFVGKEWFKYLIENKALPFAIRVKKSDQIKHINGGKMKLGKYFSNMQKGEIKVIETKIHGLPIKVTCLQLEKDQVIVASNVSIGEKALAQYKQRWGIERSFKALKTSGFNLEETHITDRKKLKKLFAIASIALAICVIAGTIKNSAIPIKIKKHGRKLFSLFTYGFDWLKDYFTNKINAQFLEWIKALQMRFKSAMKQTLHQ